jgi:hypothetical protein
MTNYFFLLRFEAAAMLVPTTIAINTYQAKCMTPCFSLRIDISVAKVQKQIKSTPFNKSSTI